MAFEFPSIGVFSAVVLEKPSETSRKRYISGSLTTRNVVRGFADGPPLTLRVMKVKDLESGCYCMGIRKNHNLGERALGEKLAKIGGIAQLGLSKRGLSMATIGG